MAADLTCQIVADEDLIPRFVRGRLTSDESERLEAHCFGCDACWSELRTAMALAASHEVAPDIQSIEEASAAGGQARWRKPAWGWLAAAATIVVAVGIGSQLARRAEPPDTAAAKPAAPPAVAGQPAQPSAAPDQPAAPRAMPGASAPVERSATAGPLTVTIARQADGSVRLTWRAVPGAASYRVGLFAADGREVFARDTADVSLEIPRSGVAALPAKAELVLQVEAQDVMRAVIARSEPARFVISR